MDAAALEQALAALAAALDAGDPTAAAEASDRAARCCAALDGAGTRLSPEALARARALHDRCLAAAEKAVAGMGDRLAAAARSWRASTAYSGR